MIDRVGIDLIAQALGLSPSQARRRASTDGWTFEAEKLPTGNTRRAYIVARLPPLVREALTPYFSQQVATLLPAPVETPVGGSPSHPSPTGVLVPSGHVSIIGDMTMLTNNQRAIVDARCAVLAYVDGLIPVTGGITAARIEVERQAKAGALPESVARLVPLANARAGKSGKRTVSATSLKRWHLERTAGQAAALAPKVPRPDMGVPAWAPALMTLRSGPQKRSLRDVVENDLAKPGALPPGVTPPSYDQVKRWLAKVSTITKNQGRLGPKELKSLMPYVKRDLSGLDPLDIVQSDGHCLDAEVLHPRHGKPFRPEITSIIDLATRMCVGWSAGLAENALGVTEAIVYMVTRYGIPAIWYVDNGSGFNNQLMDDERTGLLARLQTTKLNRLPNNPQAGGYVERSHQTIWVKGAKRLVTYMGRDMDRQAKQKVFKITRADIKAAGSTRHMMRWDEFLAWAEALVTEYNNTPHRGLPRITCPETGRRRHMKPIESWNEARERGWQPAQVSAVEAADLTRPYEVRKVTRGMVSVLGQSYFSRDLTDWHDCDVLVGYDVHDSSKVYVRDLDGRLICEAGFEANKRSVVPRSYLDQAIDRRHQGREKRALEHLKEIHAERGAVLIDSSATTVLPDNVTAIRDHLVIEMTASPAPVTASPIPETAAGRFQRWLDLDATLAAGRTLTEAEAKWHSRYQLSGEFRAWAELNESFAADSA